MAIVLERLCAVFLLLSCWTTLSVLGYNTNDLHCYSHSRNNENDFGSVQDCSPAFRYCFKITDKEGVFVERSCGTFEDDLCAKIRDNCTTTTKETDVGDDVWKAGSEICCCRSYLCNRGASLHYSITLLFASLYYVIRLIS